MGLSWARNQRLNQAFLASLAIHVLVAMLIPAFAVLNGNSYPIETISYTQLIRVRIATPRPIVHPVRAMAPTPAQIPLVSHEPAPKPAHARATQPKAVKNGKVNRAPEVSAATRQGSVTTQSGNGEPVVSASPEVEATAESPRREAGGNLPFGAQEPVPVLDRSVQDQLEALKVHVTLIVTVDDSGHTKSVVFQPPLDALTETRIRAMLATASWDPAVCGGGIPCEGSATITL